MFLLRHDPFLAGQMLTVVNLAIVKNLNFSERVSKGPDKVSGNLRIFHSIPNSDRTLSVDRPLFAALKFSVVCTHIQRYASSSCSNCCRLVRRSRLSPQQILAYVMTHTVVYKSAYHAKPHSVCFLPQYQRQRKCLFILERDQDRGTKKEQALYITFSQSDWFVAQNECF